MKNRNQIIVIGGGAAGLTAAIAAARNRAQVTILEQLNRVGKKILATGNGRCNLTNIHTGIQYYHGKNPKFIHGAFGQFDVQQTMDFFEYLGIHCKVEGGGKVYPASDQATSVLEVLRYELQRLGVKERCEAEVVAVEAAGSGFIVTLKDGEILKANKVIVATGGMASPQLGSNGSGYHLLKSLGHHLISPSPALVQLKLKSPFLKQLKGVKFIGQATLGTGERVIRTEDGEILFTDYGISGPPILQLSRMAVQALNQNNHPWLRLDLFPQFSPDQLMELIQLRLAYQPEKPLDFSFVGLLNKRLIPVLLKTAEINPITMSARALKPHDLSRILSLLKGWTFDIIGSQPWSHAQVTAGGMDVGQVNPKTMESRLVKGLYLAGELLDIDGDCGGFNLQWAWSSGYVAGDHASQSIGD